MRKNQPSIDGFVPRYPDRSVGDVRRSSLGVFDRSTTIDQAGESHQPLQSPHNPATVRAASSVSRKEIDESLRDIGTSSEQPKARRRLLAPKKPDQQKTRFSRRKIVKRFVWLILIVLLAAGAYFGYSVIKNSTSILKGNIFDIFQNKPLEMDENGRTNILIYGTSGSFEDSRHEGANLTDTLMVLSIDQKKKDAYMFNLPRDLYVNYDTVAGCTVGYQGKINAMHFCYTGGETDEASDEKGAKALQKKFKEITGLSFQYYAHINWAVVVSAVNAVGGVDVKVKGDGSCAGFGVAADSVIDYNMKVNYTPGIHHMNGDQALRFSRARGAAGGCGLGRGDFDRQLNQQKVLKALQVKATSAGTLTNIGKVTALMDAMGQNLRTDFEIAEVRTLMSLGGTISPDNIVSIDLAGEDSQLIGSGNIPGAGSIQVPTAGTYDYSAIQSHIHKKLNANKIVKEEAHVALFNASGVEGYASAQSEALEAKGFTITAIDNAPSGTYEAIEIYDISDKKPATKKKLRSIYGTKPVTGQPPFSVSSDTDFVVIFGSASSAN